jgi:phosphopantothenoylcysteine decarboxylase/phosphopantothenate--cysteine ligase
MAEPEEIAQALENMLAAAQGQWLAGCRVLVTAGPTYERIDSVRFIGNYSSGKMGFALAEALASHGAEVELVTGPTALKTTARGVHRIDVESAREMYAAATERFPSCKAAILSAAVADYRPEHTADHKLKKQGDEGMTLTLVQNPDILATLGQMKQEGQTLVGFALETNDEESNAKKKLEKKNLDFIVLNSLQNKGTCFQSDENQISIISHEGQHDYEKKTKQEVAKDIISEMERLLK